MKYARIGIYILCIVALLCGSANASPDELEEVAETAVEETDPVESTSTPDGQTQVNVFVVDGEALTGDTVITGGAETSGLIESIFGDYTPYNANGVASIDFGWMADVLVFTVLVVCFFKIVGSVMKHV